jgi:hypothetical protein
MKTKRITILKSLISGILGIAAISAFAQTEIIFNPAELTPHEDGYYKAGVYVDENQDGVDEFHNGCDDYYEDEDYIKDGFYDPSWMHQETGDQQSFKYFDCLIMPTCEYKGDGIDPPVATGYIQMHACMYSGTDTAKYSYVQSPPVSNLESIYMETSSNNSTDNRDVVYNLEYSKDLGATWENTYFQDKIITQGGLRVTYDGSVNLEIKEMIDASKVSPIVIRVITNDREATPTGQFIKLHSLKLTAVFASSIQSVNYSELVLRTEDLTIISEKQKIEVYNIMGQYIGTGNYVEVPLHGIYMVKPKNGPVQKILVN